MELEGIGHIYILGYRGDRRSLCICKRQCPSPVVKNGGALCIDCISSRSIIGGRLRAPRVHFAVSPIVLESRNDTIIRSVVLCDIVDDW